MRLVVIMVCCLLHVETKWQHRKTRSNDIPPSSLHDDHEKAICVPQIWFWTVIGAVILVALFILIALPCILYRQKRRKDPTSNTYNQGDKTRSDVSPTHTDADTGTTGDTGKETSVVDTIRNYKRQNYTMPLNSWCNELFENYSVYVIDSDRYSEEYSIKKLLKEEFIYNKRRLFLKENSIRFRRMSFLYYYILCKWGHGDILQNYIVVYINVSKKTDLLKAINDLLKPQTDLKSLTDIENEPILVLLDGIPTEMEKKVTLEDVLNIKIKSFPNMLVWTTGDIVFDEEKFVVTEKWTNKI